MKQVRRVRDFLTPQVDTQRSSDVTVGKCLAQKKTVYLNDAYDDYCDRVAAGEAVDPVEFCAHHSSHKTTLLRRIELHEYMGQNPEALNSLESIPWPNPNDVLAGTTIVEELGRGGGGRVYLANDNSLPRQLVIKAIVDERGEAKLLSKLDHPNVVPIYFIDRDSATGLNLIVMPYQGRSTLLDVLDVAFKGEVESTSRRLTWQDVMQRLLDVEPGAVAESSSYRDGALSMMASLAEALDHCHTQGVCHLDLKPSNILMTSEGVPMLIDFGMGIDFEHSELCGGTIPYMSPEQLRVVLGIENAPLPDSRSDIYSLGLLLFQTLTGKHPFAPIAQFGSEDQLLLVQSDFDVLDLGATEQLGRPVERLLKECLSTDPCKRPQASDLAKRLRCMVSGRAVVGRRAAIAAVVCGGVGLIGQRLLVTPKATDSPELHFQSGLIHRKQRNWDEALKCFNQAISKLQVESGTEDVRYLTARASVFLMRSWEMLDWIKCRGANPNFHRGERDWMQAHQDYLKAYGESGDDRCLACLAYVEYLLRDRVRAQRSAFRAKSGTMERSAEVANIFAMADAKENFEILHLQRVVTRFPMYQQALVNLARKLERRGLRESDHRSSVDGLEAINNAFDLDTRRLGMYEVKARLMVQILPTIPSKRVSCYEDEICDVLIEGLEGGFLSPEASSLWRPPPSIGPILSGVFARFLEKPRLKKVREDVPDFEPRRSIVIDHPLAGIDCLNWIPYIGEEDQALA